MKSQGKFWEGLSLGKSNSLPAKIRKKRNFGSRVQNSRGPRSLEDGRQVEGHRTESTTSKPSVEILRDLVQEIAENF